MGKRSVFLLALLVSLCLGKPTRKPNSKTRLVIIMLDGFRWDYADKFVDLPAFNQFRREGVTARYVQPVFPSVSFASWTTIATGLYPESHGIVGNYMYDPVSKMVFSLDEVGTWQDSTNDSRWWGQHTPIWASATAEGIPTSMYLWSRCDVPFSVRGQLVLPEKCVPYNNLDCLDPLKFADSLRHGLRDLESGTALLMVYYGGIDEQGHVFGPLSQEVFEDIAKASLAIEAFVEGLEKSGLLDVTNVILVSDHGMTSIASKRFQQITHYTDLGNIEKVVERNAFAMVEVAPGVNVDTVAKEIARWKDVDVYKKSEIPEHLHLRKNLLVLDLLLISKGDILIQQDFLHSDLYLPSPPPNSNQHPGSHGFDDTGPAPDRYSEGANPDMRGIFYAMGPAFKKGFAQDWIRLVDEYQIFTHLLGIAGERHNGTWSRVSDMFDNDDIPVQRRDYS